MLEFNQEHRVADLSEIKQKTEKAKNAGKVIMCGTVISAALILSGCNPDAIKNQQIEDSNQQTEVIEPITTSTAIIMENGNAMIVDLQSYSKYTEDIGSIHYNVFAEDKTWVLYTSTGDKLLVDFDSVKFIEG